MRPSSRSPNFTEGILREDLPDVVRHSLGERRSPSRQPVSVRRNSSGDLSGELRGGPMRRRHSVGDGMGAVGRNSSGGMAGVGRNIVSGGGLQEELSTDVGRSTSGGVEPTKSRRASLNAGQLAAAVGEGAAAPAGRVATPASGLELAMQRSLDLNLSEYTLRAADAIYASLKSSAAQVCVSSSPRHAAGGRSAQLPLKLRCAAPYLAAFTELLNTGWFSQPTDGGGGGGMPMLSARDDPSTISQRQRVLSSKLAPPTRRLKGSLWPLDPAVKERCGQEALSVPFMELADSPRLNAEPLPSMYKKRAKRPAFARTSIHDRVHCVEKPGAPRKRQPT